MKARCETFLQNPSIMTKQHTSAEKIGFKQTTGKGPRKLFVCGYIFFTTLYFL